MVFFCAHLHGLPELRAPQELLLPLLPHPERSLRQTAGSCISAIVEQSALATWPQLVAAIQACLSSPDTHAVTGGLDALFKASKSQQGQRTCKGLDALFRQE